MEWVFLLVDLALAGVLARIWLVSQARANELRRREDAAARHTAEHLQQLDLARRETALVEAQIPDLETQIGSLKKEVARAEDRLARIEATGGH